ncbi:MAG: hypothetical protein PVH00_13595, partial [Gemmatimonadota bacterium]
EGFTGGSAKFSTGWLLGSQLTVWPTARLGIRGNFNYSDRSLKADDELFSSVNLWSLSGVLLFRLRTPNETWQGPETLPYIALGLGAKRIAPSGNNWVCYDNVHFEYWTCAPYDRSAAGATFALGERAQQIMPLIGVGADFRLAPHWAVRVELNDRIYKPQTQAITGRIGATNVFVAPDYQENLSKIEHELSLQVGMHVLLFMRGGAAAAPPPPPPPPPPSREPPTPTPPTPPPPRVDDITVCVLDPAASGGMRTQSAQFRYASGDTVVVSGGNTVPLRQAVGSVQTARNADWFVQGTPFIMTMGRFREEFVTFGRPATVPCNSLAYVGMVNGYPVYVSPNDIAAYRADLDAAVRAANGDLSAALAGNDSLREQFDAIRTIHVPMDVVGPVLQALNRQEQVRKFEQ